MAPSEKMKMNVKNRLAGARAAVDDDTVAVFRDAFLLGETVRDAVDRADELVIFFLKIR